MAAAWIPALLVLAVVLVAGAATRDPSVQGEGWPDWWCPPSTPMNRFTAYQDTVTRLSLRRKGAQPCLALPPPFASSMILPADEVPSTEGSQDLLKSQGAQLQLFGHGPSASRARLITDKIGAVSGWGGGIAMRAPVYGQFVQAHVGNTHFATTALYHSAGLWFMVVAEQPYKGWTQTYPVKWSQVSDFVVEWHVDTGGLDVYVAFAPTIKDAVRLFWGLTGVPQLPPLYAHGFMLSRWGWADSQQVSAVLDEMDERMIGMDAFIMDFEWYLNGTGDYNLPPSGVDGFPDFSLSNAKTMPNPSSQHYEYQVRDVKMGGIRKPRLGDRQNVAEARAKGWILSATTRDLDFSKPEVRQWYADHLAGLKDTAAGLPDFWWNDEGETAYETYYYWIKAQQLLGNDPRKRRLSINRSFTPGMQALEAAAVWSGDVPNTWESLRRHVGLMIDWAESGLPLFSMDIGGFLGKDDPSNELLVRWYQLGIFAGVMRVHSIIDLLPHWPFPSLWGAVAAHCMRLAVQTRYSLLPTLYAAAVEMREKGVPWLQRASSCIDCFLVANGNLLVAPVLVAGAVNRTLALPGDAPWWVDFVNGGPAQQGVVTVKAALEHVPMFARAGSVILLGDPTNIRAAEAVGASARLYVRVFMGASASAQLVEDDGNGNAEAQRRTRFEWNEGLRLFRWTTTGAIDAPWYDRATVLFHEEDGSVEHADIEIHDQDGGELHLNGAPGSSRVAPWKGRLSLFR